MLDKPTPQVAVAEPAVVVLEIVVVHASRHPLPAMVQLAHVLLGMALNAANSVSTCTVEFDGSDSETLSNMLQAKPMESSTVEPMTSTIEIT